VLADTLRLVDELVIGRKVTDGVELRDKAREETLVLENTRFCEENEALREELRDVRKQSGR
jgi:hypothetical protein